MAISDWFRGLLKKQSPSRTLMATYSLGHPVTTPVNYESFSKEAYSKNVVAFRAIIGVAQACGQINWLMYKKRQGAMNQEIPDHPLLDLLMRPNPMQGRAAFFESLVAFFRIAGNSYIEANGPDASGLGIPTELWPMRPDRTKVIPGEFGLPSGFEYRVNGLLHKYAVDPIKGRSPICHLKTFNPLNDWYGMSPIQAASLAIDQHNASGIWNLSLLQNRATPSGAFVVQVSDSNPTGKLDDVQYARLEKRLETKFMGAENAGRPQLFEGGLDWKEMGFSPQDMDWINGKNTSARDIALALSYPPILLGIPGDSTYNNQKEARLALYEEAVLPTMDFIRDEFNNWLVPRYGDGLYLDYDRDKIDALAPKREAVWTRVQTAEFLTANEKREAVGYEPMPGGDTLFTSAALIPLELAASQDDSQDDPTTDNHGDFQNDDNSSDDSSSDPNADDPNADNADAGKRALAKLEIKARNTRFEDFVKRFTESYVGNRITKIQERSREVVVKAIREAQLDFLKEGSTLPDLTTAIQEKVSDVYEDFSKTRARTIARTETSVASNEGSRAAAKSLNIPNLQKEWLSGDDDRTRGSDIDDPTNHKVMNGVKVGVNDKFDVPSTDGGDEMDGPCDPSAPANQVVNCRCIQIYDSDSEGKSGFNIPTAKAKQQLWLKTIRQRNAFEKKFQAQLSGVFKKEAEEMLSALNGMTDARIAERTVEAVLDETKADLAAVFRANIVHVLNQFGNDVLKIGS